MRLSGQPQTSSFFIWKDFACTKTQIKPKPTNKIKLSKQKTTKATIFCASKLLRECLVWFAFLYMQNLFIKKVNWFRVVLITSFYCTESKNLLVIFAGLENLLFIFADFEQVKNSIRRNSLTYGMPCHAIGHFVFW